MIAEQVVKVDIADAVAVCHDDIIFLDMGNAGGDSH